jgi:hypothetical protein
MRLEDFLGSDDLERLRVQFPDQIEVEGTTCPVDYLFEPWKRRTKATVTVPVAVARRLSPRGCDDLLPGSLTPWWRVLDEAGRELCVARGHEALRAALESERLERAWAEARQLHETEPNSRYAEFPALLEGVSGSIEIVAGVEAYAGVAPLAGGFARRLFRSAAESRERTREALAEFLRLRLALQPEVQRLLEPEVPDALARRHARVTGRSTLTDDLHRCLWRSASGGAIPLEELDRPEARPRLDRALAETSRWAPRAVEVLETIVGVLSMVRRRLDRGEVPLEATPRLEELVATSIERLRDLRRLTSEEIEDLASVLRAGKGLAKG